MLFSIHVFVNRLNRSSKKAKGSCFYHVSIGGGMVVIRRSLLNLKLKLIRQKQFKPDSGFKIIRNFTRVSMGIRIYQPIL